ncbi:hypothetical protein ABZ896_10040 [Streptomyces sp. NPDC047072]|uniref:hypothetical protein n=1 Tax=Streptomyces sp. NPDC047072 TaxID=3154809 RepID=UPI0033EE18AA
MATLVLGMVLDRLARDAGLTAETLDGLRYPAAVDILRDGERTAAVVRAFPAHLAYSGPSFDGYAASLGFGDHSRLVRLLDKDADLVAGSDAGLSPLSVLGEAAVSVLEAHALDCPHCLASPDTCELAHRGSDIFPWGPVRSVRLLDRTTEVLTLADHRVEEPVDDAPAGKPRDHRWQFTTGRILLERWSAAPAWEPGPVPGEADEFRHVNLDSLKCPACGSHTAFEAEGRWGDPLTLYCRCGSTLATPDNSLPDGSKGRQLFKRLILREADPLYEVRLAQVRVAALRHNQARARANQHYIGPSSDEVLVAEKLDPDAADPTQALLRWARSLRASPPGGANIGFVAVPLVRAGIALEMPGARGSDAGRGLVADIREMAITLREQSARWAHTRQLVMDRVRGWQTEGGPQQWQEALAHTVPLASRRLAGEQVLDGEESEGCAALAVVLYVLSREQGIHPEQIDKQDLVAAWRHAKDHPHAVERRWQQRLQALGHDLSAPDDPVARRWREICACPELDYIVRKGLSHRHSFTFLL